MIYTPILLNSGETRVVKNPCKPIPLVQPNLSTNPSLSIDFVNHFGRHQIHYGKPIPFQLDIGWRGVWPINLTGQSLSLSLLLWQSLFICGMILIVAVGGQSPTSARLSICRQPTPFPPLLFGCLLLLSTR